uniref:uncharacterized protein n=1 Tax=Myxine glutinosa TaxID=7769 RepID=UPI00358F1578
MFELLIDLLRYQDDTLTFRKATALRYNGQINVLGGCSFVEGSVNQEPWTRNHGPGTRKCGQASPGQSGDQSRQGLSKPNRAMMALMHLLVAFTSIFLHSAESQVIVPESHIVPNKIQESIVIPCFDEPWRPGVDETLYWEFTSLDKTTEPRRVIVEALQVGDKDIVVGNVAVDHYEVSAEQLKKGNLSLTLHNPGLADSGTYNCNVGIPEERKIVASIEVHVPEKVGDCGCRNVYESCEDFLFFVGAGATLPTLSLLFPLVGSIICPPRIPQMLSRSAMKAKLRRRRKIIRRMNNNSLKLHPVSEEKTEGTEILIDPKALAKAKPSCPRPRVDHIV